MPYKKHPFSALEHFVPPGSMEVVLPFFEKYPINLTVTRERKTVNGIYRPPGKNQPYHRISVNGNLNPYKFLFTLLHEIAHLQTFIQYQNKAEPHGKEWKAFFGQLLLSCEGKSIFPDALGKTIHTVAANPPASSGTHRRLEEALARYDLFEDGKETLCNLKINDRFTTDKGKNFIIMEKRRTRYLCKEIRSGKMYLVPGMARVLKIQ